MLALACPNNSLRVFTSHPACRQVVAKVWRSACGRTCRTVDLFQICLDAFSVATGFGGLGLVARQKPCGIADTSTQFFQHNKQLLRDWNFPAGGAGFRRLDDYLCMSISAGNSADCPADFQRSEFQVKITHCKPQISPIRRPNSNPNNKPILRGVGFSCTY